MNWLYNLIEFEISSDDIFVFDEDDRLSVY
jgi:hypothetical protein